MSRSHLALCYSSSLFSICNSVPEPLLNYRCLLARLKRAPPPFDSLDPVYRTAARLSTFVPPSHSTSLYVGESISSNSNVPILLTFTYQRKAVVRIYAIRSTDDADCFILSWIHRFGRCSTLFNMARQTSRSADPSVSSLICLQTFRPMNLPRTIEELILTWSPSPLLPTPTLTPRIQSLLRPSRQAYRLVLPHHRLRAYDSGSLLV